jgi:hypothetical protein
MAAAVMFKLLSKVKREIQYTRYYSWLETMGDGTVRVGTDLAKFLLFYQKGKKEFELDHGDQIRSRVFTHAHAAIIRALKNEQQVIDAAKREYEKRQAITNSIVTFEFEKLQRLCK